MFGNPNFRNETSKKAPTVHLISTQAYRGTACNSKGAPAKSGEPLKVTCQKCITFMKRNGLLVTSAPVTIDIGPNPPEAS